jgi:hypothetical protein
MDELTIIKMFAEFTPDRDRVIAALQGGLPLINEPEIQDLVKSVIDKISGMSEADFIAIDLTDTLEPEPFQGAVIDIKNIL